MIRFDAMTIEDEEKSEDERMKKKALKLAIDCFPSILCITRCWKATRRVFHQSG